MPSCEHCGFSSPEGFRFCGGCGQALPDPRLAEEAPTSRSSLSVRSSRLAGQRRQLTVMFCDLVGSTALADQLDPEDLHEVLELYQEAGRTAVRRYGGHVAQYLGDGVLAYFGYPMAHEDDARRSVHAGLAVVAAVDSLNAQSEKRFGIRLALRVGIHTGEVVTAELGDADRRELLALGRAPNIAARLQSLASPNSVLVSAATHEQVAGFFDFEDLGLCPLKGLTQPMRVFRALRDLEVRHRFDVVAAHGLTPLVGRDSDLQVLGERWRQARAGAKQFVLVRADAGLGKSRLVHAFKERLAERPPAWLSGACSPFWQTTAFAPFLDLVRRFIGAGRADPPPELRRKLERSFQRRGLSSPRFLEPIAAAFGCTGGSASLLAGSSAARKHQLVEALAGLFLELAAEQPTVLVVEDLHWVDASSLELLAAVLHQDVEAPLLVLLTARPELGIPWFGDPRCQALDLKGLEARDAGQLAERVAKGKRLPRALLRTVVERADGVPLFIEELTRAYLASGALELRGDHYQLVLPLPTLDVPTTLRGLLTARLDRPDRAGGVAQWASCLGRDFDYELLAAVTDAEEPELIADLDCLVAEGLLMVQGRPPEAHYLFRHALIQEAASSTLLKSARRQMHDRIAAIIEKRFPLIVTEQPTRLGYHWEHAGRPDRALQYFFEAGVRAQSRYANQEAIALWSRAAELCDTGRRELPEARPWQELEVEIKEHLGDVLALTRDVQRGARAYREALEGVEADALQRARLLRKVGTILAEDRDVALAELDAALLVLGEESADRPRSWREEWVHIQLGKRAAYYWSGDLPQMERHLEAVRPFVEEYGSPLHRSQVYNSLLLVSAKRHRYRIDDEVLGFAARYLDAAAETGDPGEHADAAFVLANCLLLRGDLDSSRKQLQSALELARKVGSRAHEVRCLAYGSTLYRKSQDMARSRLHAEQGASLARASEMPIYVALCDANLAWAAWREGRFEQAGALAEGALATWSKSPLAYPHRWTASLVVFSLALRQRDLTTAAQQADLMVDPSQELLPARLDQALQSGLSALGNHDEGAARQHFAIAVTEAQRESYL